MSQERLTAELIRLLGEADFIRLSERFGGTRLYVTDAPTASIARNLGQDTARLLASRYAGSYIMVPLARERRARHYREEANLSNAEIARRLGLTERAVERIFARMHQARGADPRQPTLFPDY